jgi:hypothetical protein
MDLDADPGGPKTYGSYGSGSATLILTIVPWAVLRVTEEDKKYSLRALLAGIRSLSFYYFIFSSIVRYGSRLFFFSFILFCHKWVPYTVVLMSLRILCLTYEAGQKRCRSLN